MNKKYIDFVPGKKPNAVRGGAANAGQSVRTATRATTVQGSNPANGATVRTRTVRRVTSTRVAPAQPARVATVQRPVAARRPATAQRPVRTQQRVIRTAPAPRGATVVRTGAGTAARPSGAPVLGVVEDLNAKFVKTDVPKRPLNQAPEPSPAVIAEAKSKKLRGFRSSKKANKVAEKSADKKKGANKTANSKYEPPKTPFINQGKVEKRPLSKSSKKANAKKKPAIVPKEEPKGTVAIIQKPPKESHVGIIVTIIITIILGAAAGTVAFLLLPK